MIYVKASVNSTCFVYDASGQLFSSMHVRIMGTTRVYRKLEGGLNSKTANRDDIKTSVEAAVKSF